MRFDCQIEQLMLIHKHLNNLQIPGMGRRFRHDITDLK